MEKNFNFTTAFAMRCNAEQFESVIKEFIQMGYKTETTTSFETDYYLINNFAGGDRVTNIREDNKNTNNRLVIETFNRNLCLALAAMTDKSDGIVGEWFVHIADTDKFFTKNNLYKKQTDGTFDTFIDDNRDGHGMGIDGIKEWFRKATAGELIKYFGESKPEEKPEINPLEALQKRIEDLERNVKLLTTNMDKVIHQPEPKRYDIKTLSDIIDCTNESNLDNFLIDFKNLLILAHKAKSKGKKLNNAEFTWIDDGKNDILSYDIF